MRRERGWACDSDRIFVQSGRHLPLSGDGGSVFRASDEYASPVGHQIGLLAVLLLTSKGAAGVAGAAFVVLSATLSTAERSRLPAWRSFSAFIG